MSVRLEELRLHRPGAEVDGVRLRYRSATAGARLEGDTLTLDEPVWGAAPGQSAVLLRGDVVVGCATIAR
jgi:tRNA-specific 2-thiouridylase